MRHLSLLIICCFSAMALQAQTFTAEEQAQKFVHHVEPLGLVIIEFISPGMTFYSLKTKYQTSLDALYAANPDLDPSFIPLGHPIQIPIDTAIITFKQPLDTIHSFPIFYRVQPKETLYRISKVYLGVAPEVLVHLNPRIDEGLSIGQVIHLGWYSPDPQAEQAQMDTIEYTIMASALADTTTMQVPDSMSIVASDSLSTTISDSLAEFKITDFELQYIAEGKTIQEEKGLAVWKPGSDQSNFYVLHPTAKVGSYMEITNPMLDRTLTAKVAGNLASGIYPSNVALVVSPSIARALGVLDQQFFASWRFVE